MDRIQSARNVTKCKSLRNKLFCEIINKILLKNKSRSRSEISTSDKAHVDKSGEVMDDSTIPMNGNPQTEIYLNLLSGQAS